jgi:hypothetical protein
MTSEQRKAYHRHDEGKKNQELALRQRLRLKWLPFGGGAKPEAIDQYERFLSLADDEQQVFMATLDADEVDLYIALLSARAMYVDPTDRKDGSITEDKVKAHPERYQWKPE